MCPFRISTRLALPLTLLTVAGCSESTTPTQPSTAENDLAAPALAVPSNSWTARAATPYDRFIFGFDLGMAPNSAGQSVVYALGGTSSDEGGTGKTVKAYNVATNTWTSRTAQVGVFSSNGVGKIGNKLYFSGGFVNNESPADMTNALWAYDYSADRMIRKADLPIFSAEGVTGVISGRLYVLPGSCDGNRYPQAGSCAVEPTRRFYRYDPATNSWVSRRQAPHFHRSGAAAVLDGKLYVAGGFNGLDPVNYLDVYDPATNTWQTLAPIPAAGATAGAALRGQFYVVVQGSLNKAYGYNPATNTWKARAAPDFFGSVTRVELNGSSYLFTASGDKSALYTP